MAERPSLSSAQELPPLYEQGGLTPAHWREVLDRLIDQRRKQHDDILGRAELYATAVISGVLPSTDFHHRSYLGRRSWQLVAGLQITDKYRLPTVMHLVPSRVLPKNPIMLEIVNFAKKEYDSSFTLEDYLHYYRLTEPHVWAYRLTDDVVWEKDIGRKYEHVPGPSKWEHDTGHWFEYPGESIPVHLPEFIRCEDQKFYKRWLLTEDELTSNIDEFPKEFKYFDFVTHLRKIAELKPATISARLQLRTPNLAHIHDSPHFGIVEKPIPQAA